MTPSQFNQLDEMKQIEAAWNGTHVATRHDKEFDILLYRLSGWNYFGRGSF